MVPPVIQLPSGGCQNAKTPDSQTEQPSVVSTPGGTNMELMEDNTEAMPSQDTGQPDGDAKPKIGKSVTYSKHESHTWITCSHTHNQRKTDTKLLT